MTLIEIGSVWVDPSRIVAVQEEDTFEGVYLHTVAGPLIAQGVTVEDVLDAMTRAAVATPS